MAPTARTEGTLKDSAFGEPTAGRIVDREQIVEEIVRQNRTRQVVVHCIGLGIDSDLLRQLAAATGGTYKFVR